MPRHAQRNMVKITLTCVMILSSVIGLGNFSAAQAQPNAQLVTASPNGLVINEIFDSQNPGSEFFELFNTSAITINLSSYVIYNRDGSNPLSLLSNPVIGPGQFRAISPQSLGRPTIAGPTGLASIDFLGLRNTSPSDQIIDVVNFGGAPDVGWPNYDLFSCCFFQNSPPSMVADNPRDIQRWPDGQDTDQGRDFQNIERSPGSPSCADPYEDDDSLGAPQPQNSGTTNLHRICGEGDNDFASITMSPSFTYTIQAVALGISVDTVLRLYDASGNLLAENDPDPDRSSQIIFRPTTSASYRIQVVDRNNGGGAGFNWLYNLTISQTTAITPTPSTSVTATPGGCEDAYEPDNVFPQEARTIELNTEQLHTFCRGNNPQGDPDWIRFVASAGKIYTFYTKDLVGPTDTIIALYEADGDKLYENDDYVPGQGLSSRIDWSFTQDGVYYLTIREQRNGNSPAYRYTVGVSTTGQLPPSATSTGTATLSPFSPTPTVGPCYDAFEPDGVPETARTIYIGETQRHNVCPESDADWVKFYGRAGKAYSISTNNLGIGLDTYMWIFDADATTILAYNDDGGNGVSSRIDFIPTKEGFYYVQVKNAGDLGLPEMFYDLSLTVTPGPPVPPSTATGIIAPPVFPTDAPTELPTDPGNGTATSIPLPTREPAFTPTQGVIEPTPERPAPPPVATDAAGDLPDPVPPAQGTSEPQVPATETATIEAAPTSEQPSPTNPPVDQPTASIPGIPATGAVEVPANVESNGQPQAPAAPPAQVAQPPAAPASAAMAPILFRVFYDRDRNDQYTSTEGIRGVGIFFLDTASNYALTASLLTSEDGLSRGQVPVAPQELYIPYFSIRMPLTRFPEREVRSIWVPAVALPQSVP